KITERICVDGEEITETEFARLATDVRAESERLVEKKVLVAPPSFFEQLTMIAYLYFAERKVDMAVLEVGLGGRLDATNICEPVFTAIAPVDFDHQQYLGNTLKEIAGEKAGIIKTGIPIVVAPQAVDAMDAIRRRAIEMGAPLISVEEKTKMKKGGTDLSLFHIFGGDIWKAGIYRLKYRSLDEVYEARVNLRGWHQITNALTAIKIAEQLSARGFGITREAIARGLEQVQWPGRLEMVRLKDSPAPLLLDG